MHDDNDTGYFERGCSSCSQEQLLGMIEAAGTSLDRLTRLLDDWQDGAAQGTYLEARDEVLDEAAIAHAYLAALVRIIDWISNSATPSVDIAVEVRRMGQRFRGLQMRMRTLGITLPRS